LRLDIGKALNMTELEKHPFVDGNVENYQNIPGGFLPKEMKVLIVGTFPPKVNYFCKEDSFFFYPNAKNQFWYIIDEIHKDNPDYKKLKKTKAQNSKESDKENSDRKKEFSSSQHLGFLSSTNKCKRV